MNGPRQPENGYQSRTRTNVMRLFRWNGAWAAATLLMALGPKFLWNTALVFTLLAVALDVAVGVGMILANKKYLADLDELQRKVQLNSMGITLGAGLIASARPIAPAAPGAPARGDQLRRPKAEMSWAWLWNTVNSLNWATPDTSYQLHR